MSRPSYKELLFDERKDREEQLRWIKDAVNGSAKFYREPPYSYEEELAREIVQLHARIAELEAEIDQLTAHDATERQDDKWIPVGERLPEDTERMLTIVYDAFEDTTAISILQHYGDGDWFSWDSGRYVVTHWMPLPEPPQECE